MLVINWPYNCLQLFLKFSKGGTIINRGRCFFKLPDEIVTSFKILFLQDAATRVTGADKQLNSARTSRPVLVFT